MESELSFFQGLSRIFVIAQTEEDLPELKDLLRTLQKSCVGHTLVSVKTPSPATYLGSGKVVEVGELIQAVDPPVQGVLFDAMLSPNQLKQLEKAWKVPVLDRPSLIIEIFSQNARTLEAQTQVALARFQYLLPRLTHFWTHFERQRGGGVTSRGMGEKQLEVDRRLIKDQVAQLKQKLVNIRQERALRRERRNRSFFQVALVGYTNAGKSTLLNAFTESHVLAEDKLFATLDSSVRALNPQGHPPIVVIDTVGFIRNLPPTLVASFRSTLEELQEADLLLHVLDASHPQAPAHFETTEKLLVEDLGLGDRPRWLICNKSDLLVDKSQDWTLLKSLLPRQEVPAKLISANRPEEIRQLREALLEFFKNRLPLWEVWIPYHESKREAQLYAKGYVEAKTHLEKGTFYRVRMDPQWAAELGLKPLGEIPSEDSTD